MATLEEMKEEITALQKRVELWAHEEKTMEVFIGRQGQPFYLDAGHSRASMDEEMIQAVKTVVFHIIHARRSERGLLSINSIPL